MGCLDSSLVGGMVGCLVGFFVGWLVGWLVGWFAGWSIGWLVGSSVDLFVSGLDGGRMVSHSEIWLVGRSVSGLSVGRSFASGWVGWFFRWFCRSAGALFVSASVGRSVVCSVSQPVVCFCWLFGGYVICLISCLVGWLIGWFVGWLVGWWFG